MPYIIHKKAPFSSSKVPRGFTPLAVIPDLIRDLGAKPLKMLFALCSKLLALPSYLLPHKIMRRLSSTQRLFLNMVITAVILIFSVFIYTTMTNPDQTKAAWFDGNWLYRTSIPITNTSGSELTNYQILIATDTARMINEGKLQSDCDDLRVINANGTILPHWVETGAKGCNTSVTNIWVKVPIVPTSGGQLFLYYGNTSALNNQNGNKVFELFDDFSGNTLDPLKWVQGTIGATSGTSFTVAGGLLTGGNSNRTITSVKSFTGDYSAETRTYTTTPVANGFTPIGFWSSTSNGWAILDHNGTSYYRNDATWVNFGYSGNTQWTRNSAKVAGTTGTYARIGETSGSATNTGTNSGISGENIRLSARSDNSANDQSYAANWDWIFVRKASTNEPATSVSTEEKSPGPVAYWKLDEGTGSVANDATGKNSATLQGSPTWKDTGSCVVGKCLQFNGSSQYLTASNNQSLNPTTGLTIQAWVKPTSIASSTNYNIVAKQDWNNELGYRLAITGYGCSTNCLFMGVGDGTNQTEISGSDINLNDTGNWHHITGVFNAGNLYLYVDGVLKYTTTTPVTSISNTSSGLAIGRHSSGGEYFPGFLDDVKIYPYARSAAQIKSDFSSRGSVAGTSVIAGKDGSSSLSNGLVGYWKMDESTGNTCTGGANDTCDSSGNGNDSAWNVNATASTSGKFGLSTIYDGASYGQIAASSTLQITDELTVCSWVNTWQTSMNGGIFEKTSNGSVNTGYLLFAEGTTYRWRVNNGANSTVASTSTLSNLQNKWSHVCGTYSKKDNGRLAIFVNGTQQATGQITGTTTINSGSGVSYLGSLSGTYRYYGALDETRVYKRALSPHEIAQLYSFAPGPKAQYAFDETSGAVANDTSGSNNTGTINNGPTVVQGKYGRGRNFNGSGKNVSLASPIGNTATITASLWYKRDEQSASSTWRTLLADATANIHHLVSHQTTRNLGIWDGSFKDFGYAPPTDNKWHHYAMILESNVRARLYVDGKYQSQVATTLNLSTYPIGKIGNWNSGSYYSGQIDDVRIYDYERSPKQIIEDLNGGHPAGGSPVGSQVVHFKMNEGYGTTTNNSGGNSTLTGSINGPTWSNDGKNGKGLNFDGVDDYVQITDNAALDLTSEWTVGGWFRPDETVLSGSDRQALISKWQTSSGTLINYYLYINTAGKAIGTVGNGSASQSVTSTTTLSPNKWYHIMATFNGATGNLKIYINGRPEATTATGYIASYANTGNVRLGQYDFAWGAYRDEYKGLMDDVKIYGSELSSEQIKIDMAQNASLVLGSTSTSSDGSSASNSASRAYCVPGDTSTCSAPVAEWKFDEKSGTATNDTSGNGLSGTVSGATWTQGKIGSGLYFDGADDYVSLGSNDTLNITGNIGIEAWIYPVGWGESNYGRIVERYNGADGYRLFLAQDGSNNRLSFYANGQVYSSVGSISLNRWHHVVVTVSGTTVTFYVNGVAYNAGTIAGIVSAPGTTAYIGNNSTTDRSFQGKIDHVRIYNYARTPAQIAYDYNRGKPVTWYKMDECQGSTFNDSAGGTVSAALTIGGSGTQTSAGTCQTASTAWGNGATGKFNSSLRFDGTDDYAVMNDTIYTQATSNISVSLWVKPNMLGSQLVNYPISKGIGGAAAQGWAFGINGTNNSGCANAVGKVYLFTNNTIICGSTISTGTWTHMVFTNDGTTTKIYVNGLLAGSGAQTIQTSIANNINIGRRSDASWYYNGQVDDVQIFNYVLTASQVKGVQNQNSSIRFGPATGTP